MLLIAEQFRRCGRCGSVKPTVQFNLSSAFGRQYWCRDCQKTWYHENRIRHIANVNVNTERYRDRNTAFILDHFRSHPCVDCGETDPRVLEFDHVGGKERHVSQLTWSSAPIERIAAEIEKCEVRCVNCHMKRTAAQFGWRKARDH